IMTVPYGAAASAQAAHVLAAIAGRIEAALADEGGPLWAAVRELGAAVAALSAHPSGTTSTFLRRMRGCLRAVATGGQADSLLARLRKKAYEAYPRSVPKASGALPESPASREASGGDRAVIGQNDWYDWLGVAALGAFAAREIVAALRKTLDSRYPGVNGFGRWLKEVGTACSGMPLTLMAGRQYRGMPLTWLTPLGLPVCQDKFRLHRSSLSADFGGKRISIGTRRLTEEVSWMSQQNALLPNLIHSLDATHLAMTINSAVARGLHRFGSIHDCLLCHPSEAERFGELLRNSFRELYKTGKNGRRPAVLVQWSIWMQIVADIATTDQVLVLLGALDVPDGFGERLLRTLPNTDAVSLLDRIRRLDQARQSVARLLLEFRRDAADAQAGAGVGRQVLPELPGGGDFNVDGVIDSRYFFS
ncbi:MAG: hypothetical protein KA223_10540, partial [Candidatus Accumulibacter sp.]|nr:hypothetical protein [Accumulibacter sp.]